MHKRAYSNLSRQNEKGSDVYNQVARKSEIQRMGKTLHHIHNKGNGRKKTLHEIYEKLRIINKM
ncbi:MAG TPA: hypothetical protein DCF33_12845 [Saprospirales bacterium]|nr:hypothetical protein [Saprospirales bacterium]